MLHFGMIYIWALSVTYDCFGFILILCNVVKFEVKESQDNELNIKSSIVHILPV